MWQNRGRLNSGTFSVEQMRAVQNQPYCQSSSQNDKPDNLSSFFSKIITMDQRN